MGVVVVVGGAGVGLERRAEQESNCQGVRGYCNGQDGIQRRISVVSLPKVG